MAKQLNAVRHYRSRFRTIINHHHQRTGWQVLHMLYKRSLQNFSALVRRYCNADPR
ncbi:hypothetical protein ENTKAS01_27020 [Enterobacter sp. AS-1]|nr:hypothetical protein ENTKAS01_27020 [Enterobacter sp. AS-1]